MAYNDFQTVESNGAYTIWAVPLGGIADIDAPTAAEINAGLLISDVVRIDGTDFGPQTSEQIDDRSWGDNAAATYRGFDQFSGSVVLYEPKVEDASSIARQAKTLLGGFRPTFYWVERFADGKTKNDPAAAGDYVSVFKVTADSKQFDTSDRNLGITYTRALVPRGDVAINVLVKTAATPTYAPTTLAIGVGDHGVVKATLAGRDVTRGGDWVSSDPDVATVSPNGVVTGVAAGTATITTSLAAATGTGSGTAVTVS